MFSLYACGWGLCCVVYLKVLNAKILRWALLCFFNLYGFPINIRYVQKIYHESLNISFSKFVCLSLFYVTVSVISISLADRGRVMASGWGITGNKGRCYDFWMDFSECMSRCREPKDCSLLREDYLECLHHSKEVISIPQLLVFLTPLSPSSLIVLLVSGNQYQGHTQGLEISRNYCYNDVEVLLNLSDIIVKLPLS